MLDLLVEHVKEIDFYIEIIQQTWIQLGILSTPRHELQSIIKLYRNEGGMEQTSTTFDYHMENWIWRKIIVFSGYNAPAIFWNHKGGP